MRVTRVTNQLQRSTQALSCHLRVVGGPDAGLVVSLPPIGVVVGADPSVDVVLTDSAVSGRHCSIAPADDGFQVKDLGSRNGTLLDGVAITEAVVPIGAMLRLGASLIQLMPAEECVEIPPSQASGFGSMIGGSVVMRRVYSMLERASQSDASILCLGESGTGKELIARAVHENSPRSDGPFVVFDCGAASETLIESELFGHVRGAFTGAHADRVGAFAAANKGTLFLDEIGDLPLAMQPKLLRMLETGEVTQVGSHKQQQYDVRLVAATHRDLFAEVGTGGFRGDLYYRLAVIEIYLPSLRQRSEDIPQLVRIFLDRATGRVNGDLSGPNMDRLISYHWPGNVRELRNVITRAVALSAADADFDGMPILLRPTQQHPDGPAFRADRPFHEAKAAIVGKFETEYLTDLIRRADGNLSQAARDAGVERKYLYRLLEKNGMR